MRTQHILDNPVWSALSGSHQHLSTGHDVKRYSTQRAPFIAVRDADSPSLAAVGELPALVALQEAVYFMGPTPALPSSFATESLPPLIQMICDHPIPASPNEQHISPLFEPDVDHMLGLTALVFPGFFRRRTSELGRYFGIWDGARLVAMAGERLFAAPYREISGVCTHTDYLGRGFAGQLITHLVNLNLVEGAVPFLTVRSDNARAISLYEKLGFTTRRQLPFTVARRMG